MSPKQLHITAWLTMFVCLASMAFFAIGAAMEFYAPNPDYEFILAFSLIAVFSFITGLIVSHYGDRIKGY
jgi:hypothetical protein